jgi:hypothetical protein
VRVLIRVMVKFCLNQMYHFFLIGCVLVLSSFILHGQSISDLRKFWQNGNISFPTENQKEKLFSKADFSKYALARDDDFAAYLKETWSDYSILDGTPDEAQHPTQQPVFDELSMDMNPPTNLPFTNVVDFNNDITSQIRMIPRIRKPEPETFNTLKVVFSFYGQQLTISYDKLIVLSKINSFSEDSIALYWESFARSSSNHLVDQLMDYRDLLGLGDWGYFQLIKATSKSIFSNNVLNADLLTWALMIRSGFDVRLAFNQSITTVLFPCANIIYSKKFVVIAGRRFYLDREMKSQLLVSSQNSFPDNAKMIDLNFYKSLNFSGKLSAENISVQWNSKSYMFSLRYNPQLIRFYSDYPRTDPSVYFGAPVSSTLKEDLLRQFYPILSKLDKREATAFLQQLVQKKFQYVSENQKDDFPHGHFAEEIIASKSGNDTGKAVLFSSLVKILLHLPVVGVQFPGYFSTAVCYDTPIDGNYYILNREKYYITDPTFVNAPIGVMMPEFDGLTPRLIDLPKGFSDANNALKIWELALNLGARRGGTNQDIVFDHHGSTLITGYFCDNGSSLYPFIACFSRGKSLQWIRKFEGSGKALAYAITKASDDEIYIAGTFKGRITMDEKELQTQGDKPDIFICQFNHSGDLVWMNKAGVDSSTEKESLSYLVKFDRTGENISTQFSNEDERNLRTGFSNPTETGFCFTGSKFFTADGVPIAWNDSKSDVSRASHNDYYASDDKKSHSKIEGALEIFEFLQKSGAEVRGIELQALIRRRYPTFAVINAPLYKAIAQVELLKNDNGIVSLKTIGGKPILYNNLNLQDGARFNISVFDNGDLSVKIISGFEKIVERLALPLNSLLVDRSSGNLILDYDTDHTIKTVSLAINLSTK